MPDQKQKPSVFISIFTLDERDGWLCRGLAQFLAAMSIAAKERAVCLQLSANVKPIDWARNKVVKDFLASGCEWLLMVDSDMAPPPNLLDMIDRAEPRMDVLVPRFYALMSDVVAANSPQTIANQPGLRLLHGWQTFAGGPGQNEWSEIAWAGTGTMFVHRRVFEGLGDHGWFRFVYDENGMMINSEDVSFCQKARRAGFSVWGNQRFEVDHFKTASLCKLARGVKVAYPNLPPGEDGLDMTALHSKAAVPR